MTFIKTSTDAQKTIDEIKINMYWTFIYIFNANVTKIKSRTSVEYMNTFNVLFSQNFHNKILFNFNFVTMSWLCLQKTPNSDIWQTCCSKMLIFISL